MTANAVRRVAQADRQGARACSPARARARGLFRALAFALARALAGVLAVGLTVAIPGGAALAEPAPPPLQRWTRPLPAPADLQDLSGAPASLEAYRGRVLVVNLWASWCAPCREELPTLERLRIVFAGRPLEVVAISVGDTLQRVNRFLEQLPVDVPVLVDRSGTLLKAWDSRVLPTTWILDATGRPRWRFVGARNWDEPEVLRALEALLPK